MHVRQGTGKEDLGFGIQDSGFRVKTTKRLNISRYSNCTIHAFEDVLAVEEPMEIRLCYGPLNIRLAKSVSITMRTPGNDFELAAGFLFTEGIIRDPNHIEKMFFCGPPPPGKQQSNIVRVEIAPDVELDIERLQRNFYTTSSCGICGKSSLDAITTQMPFAIGNANISILPQTIKTLGASLRQQQPTFDKTGGLHAAGLFGLNGTFILAKEDVGRHNAVDKLIGEQFLKGVLPLRHKILMLSGRSSFELIQKSAMAGIEVVASVGAPSTLAVSMAKRFNITLIGFARSDRFNIYSVPERIRL